MNERERSICSRVRKFREAIRWAQVDFAEQLGLTRDQLAGIEYCRTPLGYRIAWNIRFVFGVSLGWLADGRGRPEGKDLDPWPAPESVTKPLLLLSEVEESLWDAGADKPHAADVHEKAPPHLPQRSALLSLLKESLADWIAWLPSDKVYDFTKALAGFAEAYLDKVPHDPQATIDRRRVALIWDSMRVDIARRLLGKAVREPPFGLAGKDSLDTPRLSDTLSGVRTEKPNVPTWEELKREIARLTAGRGEKSALAAELGVSRQVLGNWLSSGAQGAPNAELTLRLFRWVLSKRRKQKSPGRAVTRPERETRPRNTNENPESSPPKR